MAQEADPVGRSTAAARAEQRLSGDEPGRPAMSSTLPAMAIGRRREEKRRRKMERKKRGKIV